MTPHGPANTLKPIDIDAEEWKGLPSAELVKAVHAKALAYFDKSAAFYRDRQKDRWGKMRALRVLTVIAGTLGILLTACAAVARYWNLSKPADTTDAALLLAALVAYALMTALVFAERGLEMSTSYFRAVGTAMALRDLKTRFLFNEAIAAQQTAGDLDSEQRQALLKRAADFCIGVDTIVTGEAASWQQAYFDVSKSLGDTAASGLSAAAGRYDEALKAVIDTRAALVKEQKEALDKERSDALPVALSVRIKAGPPGGTATVLLDGQQRGQGAQREFAIINLARGTHVLKVTYQPPTGDAQVIERPLILTHANSQETVDFTAG